MISHQYFMQLVALGKRVVKEGENRRIDAAHSGNEYGQVYADSIIREGKAFLCGLEGFIPEGWEKYKEMVAFEADPEYNEYMRLKEKFGGR